jgi:uncharacterized protein (DUF2267 family)
MNPLNAGRKFVMAGRIAQDVARVPSCLASPPSIEATTMDYETFVTTVAELARTDRAGTERAIRATLQTPAEHVTREEARQVAGLLPVKLGPWLHTGSWGAQRFDVDEFVRRVSERAQVDLSTTQRYAAVSTALSRAVPEEYDNIVAQLPRDFTPLLSRGPDIEAVLAAQFLSRIADRAELDPDGARRASEAVLQTLAERIAGGEVTDLMMWLPVEMHDPLKRGIAASNGMARKRSRRTASSCGSPSAREWISSRRSRTPGRYSRHCAR